MRPKHVVRSPEARTVEFPDDHEVRLRQEKRRGDTIPSHRVRRRRRRRRLRMLLGALLGVAIVAGGVVAFGVIDRLQSSALLDMRGIPVEPDPDARLTEDEERMAATVDDTGLRFAVQSVGLDVPLGAVNPIGGRIAPSGYASVYRVRDVGVELAKADSGTVYVVTHSLRGGGTAPGNYLFDPRSGGSALVVGDTITVGTREYQLTHSEVIGKDDLATRADVWGADPGRLVVITCLQKPSGAPSDANFVMFAQSHTD